MIMNDPIDWSEQSKKDEETWRNYFNLMLTNLQNVMESEFNEFEIYPYDDPRDFVNGFTLAGSFFVGLHLEQNPLIRKQNVASFRKTLAMFMISVIHDLEHNER